jgi:hypothetical protein
MPRRNTLAFKSGRVTWPPIRTSQSHLRSLVCTFSTLALDHTTQLFNSDLSFLVSMLQLTGCPPQAFSRTSAVLCNQSHSRLSLFPSLCRHLVTIAICLIQPSLYLWSFIMLSYKSRHSTTVISVSQVILSLILSLFIFVALYLHVTNCSIQASQEFGP